MAFFAIAFLWLAGLFSVGGMMWVLILFSVYRLTGGKLSFLAWFRAMQL